MAMNRGAASASTTGRRKTMRHLDEVEEGEVEGRRAKRAKAGREGEEIANGNGNGAGRGKRKRAYEETDEDFAFSRIKSRRGAKKTDDAPAPEPARIAQEDRAPAAQQTRKKPRKTLPVTPEKEAPTVRRSKRLSGENEMRSAGLDDPFVEGVTRTGRKGPIAKTPAARTEKLEQTQREESPALENRGVDAIHVAKKRTPKRIDLKESETPVIRRNKAMRQTSGETSRRSSAGLRGKRASSLIDNGNSNAIPHTEVATADFYKHISQDLIEPRRMKQLLVWCGSRALGEKRIEGETAEEGQARHAARTIQEELLAAFAARNDLSNWFDRPDEATGSVSLIKKPNPRNVQNVAKLAELEAELVRLRSEKASWDSLLESVPSAASEPAPAPSTTPPPPLDPATINPALLSPSQAQILTSLITPLSPQVSAPSQQPPQPIDEQVQSRLAASAKDLHFKLDLYYDSLHRLEQFVETADKVADKVLEKTAERLEEREKERQARGEREHGGKVGQMETLRALGRAMNKGQGS
ncbi:hypothetical protein CAC42_4587 [Sphaceloma murrayae]|uniref:Kinetochore protein mis13 n=1 Tax=Sphaceloma murrayae TaxID=2082308 RepID=A0A2K1QP46_9PEZI|nr:hypothetical protein CAC42_4587 [Sphaceloma murrayae]